MGSLLALAGAAIALGAAWQGTLETIRAPGRTSVAELVTAASAMAALILLGWVCVGVLLSVAAVLPGPLGALAARAGHRVVSAAVRRWAAILIGASIVSACGPGGAVAHSVTGSPSVVASASSAADDETAPVIGDRRDAPAPRWVGGGPAPGSAAVPAPAPEWLPHPVRSHPPVTLTAARELTTEHDELEVVVHRGDTLWDLAAAHLPDTATDAQIDAEWKRWYAANADVIGTDPDLILPGQRLVIPAAPDALGSVPTARGDR